MLQELQVDIGVENSKLTVLVVLDLSILAQKKLIEEYTIKLQTLVNNN